MPWHKHTPQASNTFSRNSMTTRWLRLDFEAYECDRIQAEKEEAANTQASIGPMIEEGAQEQKEEEETRQGTPRPQNPNRRHQLQHPRWRLNVTSLTHWTSYTTKSLPMKSRLKHHRSHPCKYRANDRSNDQSPNRVIATTKGHPRDFGQRMRIP